MSSSKPNHRLIRAAVASVLAASQEVAVVCKEIPGEASDPVRLAWARRTSAAFERARRARSRLLRVLRSSIDRQPSVMLINRDKVIRPLAIIIDGNFVAWSQSGNDSLAVVPTEDVLKL